MAPMVKFTHPGSAVVLSAALILLSVSATGERQCAWCGPLAEQVHRSQRAPPCDQPEQITCDPGLSHCAIVASSPPYVESRLCVKYYQDECYSIFCNSTRTWRMTCPCRGDLCNKEKTEREDEAFALIARLGSKIQNLRIKKRTIPLAKLISPNTDRTPIVNNEKYNDGNKSDEADKNLMTDKSNMTDINNNDMTSETEMKDTDGNKPSDKSNNDAGLNTNNDQNEISQDNVNMTPGIMDESNKSDNEVEATTSPPNVIKASAMPTTVEIAINTLQRNPIVEPGLTTMETPPKDINIDIANNIDHAAELSATEKPIEGNSMKSDIKPDMEMPTAEALQQTSSPSAITQKTQMTTEQTPETTVMMMTTRGNVLVTVTPDPMKMKNNNSVRISMHNLLVLFGILLFFV